MFRPRKSDKQKAANRSFYLDPQQLAWLARKGKPLNKQLREDLATLKIITDQAKGDLGKMPLAAFLQVLETTLSLGEVSSVPTPRLLPPSLSPAARAEPENATPAPRRRGRPPKAAMATPKPPKGAIELKLDEILLGDVEAARKKLAKDLDGRGAPPWELGPTLELMLLVGLGALGVRSAVRVKKNCLQVTSPSGDRLGPLHLVPSAPLRKLLEVAAGKFSRENDRPGEPDWELDRTVDNLLLRGAGAMRIDGKGPIQIGDPDYLILVPEQYKGKRR
jgi:hypothetical protein